MKLVSVIIPYFKKRIYIEEAIKSVLRQSYKKLEIILIYDDENHDDLNFIKKIQRTDNRINLFINQKTLGVGETRNLGIKKANGEYIAFLDQPDEIIADSVVMTTDYELTGKTIDFGSILFDEIIEVNNESYKVRSVRKIDDGSLCKVSLTKTEE